MIGDPASAPPRTDLPFLRRRSRPRGPAPERTAQPAAPPRQPAVDYHRPDRDAASLDLSAPTAPAPASAPPPIDFTHRGPAPAPAAPSTPARIDYTHRASAPTPPVPAAPARSGSLDLSDPAPAPAPPSTATRAAAARPPTPSVRPRRAVRVHGRERHVLTRQSPVVTLTRVQSGVGQLTVDALVSPQVGDLRLGALYQFRSGGSSVVQLSAGRRFGPPSGRRPVLVASVEDGSDRLALDLRQIGEVSRVAVYAVSESRAPLTWGGTLVLTTYVGARVELPLEPLYPGSLAVLMSLFNNNGELVVRAEMETIAGDLRDAARAYGYDRITWRDDRTPVD